MEINITFKPQDIWVGLFNARGTKYAGAVYITLVPCFPLEIRWREAPRNAGFAIPMAEQTGIERVTEEMAKRIYTDWAIGSRLWEKTTKKEKEPWEKTATRLLQISGIAILDDNQSLPESILGLATLSFYREELDKDNWRKVIE